MRKWLAWILLDLAMWLLWPESKHGVIKLNYYGDEEWIELLPNGGTPDPFVGINNRGR